MGELIGVAEQKRQLRAEAVARRDALDDRGGRSAAICAAVLGTAQWASARAIHCFLPMGSEVDTRPLVLAALAAGKGVAIPITPRDGPLQHAWISGLAPELFEPGRFGTLRPRVVVPAAPGDWGLTIVPLLAFDRAGYRLGYGKGYYDRLLAACGSDAVGVAFAAQEWPALPHEAHDVPLPLIVTEAEPIACGPPSRFTA